MLGCRFELGLTKPGLHSTDNHSESLFVPTVWVKSKQHQTDWEKIFTNATLNRRLIFNIYKELKQLDFREPNNPIKNGIQKLGVVAHAFNPALGRQRQADL